MKSDDNLLNPAQRLMDAPRCCAKSKRSGEKCKAPAVKGWTVCRMHGAGGGAPEGKRNGMWKHGARSHQATMARATYLDLVKWAQSSIADTN